MCLSLTKPPTKPTAYITNITDSIHIYAYGIYMYRIYIYVLLDGFDSVGLLVMYAVGFASDKHKLRYADIYMLVTNNTLLDRGD